MEEYKKIIKKHTKWIIMFISIIMFFYIVNKINENTIQKFDNQTYIITSLLMHPVITQILKVITHFGDWIIMIPVTIVMLIKNRKHGILVSINLISIFIFNQLLKLIFNRPRPIENRLISAEGYSFPSGHSMVSMAFYGFLIYLICKNMKNVKWKYALCILLSILILIIGISRIYLGVHYASDVAGGFLLGLAYLIIYTQVTKKSKEEK